MENQEIFDKVLTILSPYVRNKEAMETANNETSILKDLKVNSSRLVDVVLAFEDEFDIEIADGEADKIRSLGAAVDMIQAKA